MSQGADSISQEQSLEQSARGARTRSAHAVPLFQASLRGRPVRRSLELVGEYGMFAAGAGLALALYATRLPMRSLDRALGLSLRERFIELLARVSPG
jgi:hypothetical protein